MRSTCARALARLMAALLVLAGMAGCTFQPDGLLPADGIPRDGGQADGATPVDGSPAPDGMTPLDGRLPSVDATPSNQRRKRITIQESRVEAPASPGFLEDFPVLFSVVDPQIAARASADGSDIYFVAADGVSRLEHELEKWDPGTGELVAWVKLPEVSATVNTAFHVHYGDEERAEPVNPADVWTNDFVAVWHLAADPGPGTAGDIVDSTNGNDGTAHSSMEASDLVAGQIGDALDFDGANDEIAFENPLSGDTPHTISAWVLQRNTFSHDALVVLGNGAGNEARWFYSAYFDSHVAFGFFANDEVTDLDIRGNGWTLLHWTFDGGTGNRLYVNGAPQGGLLTRAAGVDTDGNAGRIGNAPSPAFGGGMNLDGQADEVRIATAVRPAEWIRTEFNNQSDPASFYTVGPEEP
jgi:biopolymer transport protein ExbB